jgi:hypothetical protein
LKKKNHLYLSLYNFHFFDLNSMSTCAIV